MARQKLPPITVGNVTLPIYQKTNRGRPMFMVRYSFNGKIREFSNRDQQVVRDKAREIATSISNGRMIALTLTDEARIDYATAIENLIPTKKSLASATHEYAEAWQLLDGRSIITAATYYAKEIPKNLPRIAILGALDEMVNEMKWRNLAPQTIKHIRSTVKAFAKDFKGVVSDIDKPAVKSFLKRYSNPKTKNNNRSDLGTFLYWCKENGYLPPNKPVAIEDIHKAKERHGRPPIFTVADAQKIMDSADWLLAPYAAICLFAMVRPDETARLQWDDVDFEEGIINISELVSKTGQHRTVPMSDNLKAWLEPYRGCKGALCILNHPQELLSKRSGVPWIDDGLRHTGASYRYAILRSVGALADEMGNSPAIVRRNYLNRGILAKDVEVFWQILPTKNLEKPLPLLTQGKLDFLRLHRTVAVRLELERRAGKQAGETKNAEPHAEVVERITMDVKKLLHNAAWPDFTRRQKS